MSGEDLLNRIWDQIPKLEKTQPEIARDEIEILLTAAPLIQAWTRLETIIAKAKERLLTTGFEREAVYWMAREELLAEWPDAIDYGKALLKLRDDLGLSQLT